jgi:hypothetical protein
MEHVEDGIIVNLLTSLVISLLMSIEQQMPDHSRKARAIRKVEDALREFAALNSQPLEDDLVHAGVNIWNKCIEELQLVFENISDTTLQDEQLELFHYDRNNVLYLTTYTTTNE